MLRILPYVEQQSTYANWNWGMNVYGNGAGGGIGSTSPAQTEIKQFYCPTRRSGVRSGTDGNFTTSVAGTIMLFPSGGTDYGGCVGRLTWAATNDRNMPTPGGPTTTDLSYGYPTAANTAPTTALGPYPIGFTNSATNCWGIFGQVNASTGFQSIVDGTSNTIMTGELQRIPSTTYAIASRDGWAVGGDATLFSTACSAVARATAPDSSGTLIGVSNGGYWAQPGSEHSGTVNFGLADGSVRALATSMNGNIFSALGSMADRTPAGPDSQ